MSPAGNVTYDCNYTSPDERNPGEYTTVKMTVTDGPTQGPSSCSFSGTAHGGFSYSGVGTAPYCNVVAYSLDGSVTNIEFTHPPFGWGFISKIDGNEHVMPLTCVVVK